LDIAWFGRVCFAGLVGNVPLDVATELLKTIGSETQLGDEPFGCDIAVLTAYYHRRF
jgi:hypothetical protein